MSRATKATLIKLLTHTLFLAVLYVLQSMVFSRLRIFGASPLIIPLAVVGVAIFQGAGWGGGFGIAAGVMCDIAFSETTILFTVLLTILGSAVGLLADFFLARGFPSFLLCCVISLLIIAFLQMFSFLMFYDVDKIILLRTGLLQTLYSCLFVLPVYNISRRLSRKQRTL